MLFVWVYFVKRFQCETGHWKDTTYQNRNDEASMTQIHFDVCVCVCRLFDRWTEATVKKIEKWKFVDILLSLGTASLFPASIWNFKVSLFEILMQIA